MSSSNHKRWLAALALSIAAAVQAAPRDGLEVRLTTAQPVLRGDVDVNVTVTVTNGARHPIHVLRWQLPGDEVEGALFRITRDDGAPVRYTGALIKRAAPDAADRVKLDPGQSLSFDVELTGTYDFARDGRYTIEYASRGKHGSDAQQLSSEPMYLWLEGRSAKAPAPEAAVTAAAASITYSGNCRTSQTSVLAQAVANAGTYANSAAAYLGGAASATQRYVTWFGAFSNSGWNTARSHFNAIADAFATKPLTLDCSCRKKNVYAYVYPTQPYKIYVCGAFWNAPATGTDSKAGTLVHEMSHFNVVAGTDDNAYGQTAARALAIGDPAKALDNADSHEYFAENTPFLP